MNVSTIRPTRKGTAGWFSEVAHDDVLLSMDVNNLSPLIYKGAQLMPVFRRVAETATASDN